MKAVFIILLIAVLIVCAGTVTAKLNANTMRAQCARACSTYSTIMDCATATYHDISYCSWVGEVRDNTCIQSCRLRDDITEAPEEVSTEFEFYPFYPSDVSIRPTITATPGVSYTSVTSHLDDRIFPVTRSLLSTDRCGFYTFPYHLDSISIPYQVELALCEPREGGHTCYYRVPDADYFPPGTDLCPELPQRRSVDGGCELCLTEQTCTLTIPDVDADFGVVVRECGSDITIAQASGNPIDTADYQFIQAALAICEATVTDELCGTVPECPVGEQVCGNGIQEAGEECDDGNTQSDDGCSSQCKDEKTICDGVLTPGQPPTELRGAIPILISIVIDTHNIFLGKIPFSGKIIITLLIDKLRAGHLPEKLVYKLRAEGNNAIWPGVYGASMEKIAQKSPELWALLTQVEGSGIIGRGFVYTLKQDMLTIDKVYSKDPSIFDLVNPHKDRRDNWIESEIQIEIRYKEGRDAVIIVSHSLRDTSENKFNVRKGPVSVTYSEEKTRRLILELLNNVKSYETAKTMKQTNLPVTNGEEVRERYAAGTLNPGVTLAQKEGSLGNKYTYDKTITYAQSIIQNLLRYIRECIETLLEGRSGIEADDVFVALTIDLDVA